MTKRRIAIFSSTRADYGLLHTLYRELEQREDCVPLFLMAGTHLRAEFGNTIDEMLSEGISPAATLDFGDGGGGSAADVCAVMGKAMAMTGSALYEFKPDLLVVLGDRYEALCAAAAANICAIPLAHLHGGESTAGAFDDNIRHAISKLASLHFAATAQAMLKIIQMGESSERVFHVGALGVENILKLQRIPEVELRRDLGLPPEKPFFLITFHPVTLEGGQAERQLCELLAALDNFPDYLTVFTGANADPEGARINTLLREHVAKMPDRRFFSLSLGQKRYLSLAAIAACVLGNSSSGILEIPSLRTAVVDMGNRQKGRERSKAVIHCEISREAIAHSLREALSPDHAKLARSAPNPYQKHGTARQIAKILNTFPMENILQKSLVPDVPPTSHVEQKAI